MSADAAAPGVRPARRHASAKGAAVLATGTEDPAAGCVPAPAADHPETDAVCLIQAFYGMADRLAARRGTDVERPRHLQKVARAR